MTDTPGPDTSNVILMPRRKTPSRNEAIVEELDLRLAGYFREQAESFQKMNADLNAQVKRIMFGLERLLGEVEGVRTGQKEEAFARVTGSDGLPDLPTVSADAALVYTLTSAKIGVILGFTATEIGALLGPKGLGWADNGDYQEVGRWQKGHTKYWHADVPGKLRKILTEHEPGDLGVTNRVAISMFARWKQRSE